jgi:hypothetical protein
MASNIDIINFWKVENIWWGTFKWNDSETGKFKYEKRELNTADIGFLI